MHFLEIKQALDANDPEALSILAREISEEEMKELARRDRAGYQKIRDLRALGAVQRGVSPCIQVKDAVVISGRRADGALVIGGSPELRAMTPEQRRGYYLKKPAEGRSQS